MATLPPRRAVPPAPTSQLYLHNAPSRVPPPPPPRKAPSLPPRRGSRDPELERLLSRKPPPPPIAKSALPAPPARRLPPMPARLPTPEPEPEPELEEEEESLACIKCHDWSFVDSHASGFPRQSVTSLPLLVEQLTSPWDSETEKARAIFYWLHCNIVYDVDSFFSGNISASSPEQTLRSGLAVCDGYAGLFSELASLCGLQAHKVTGFGKGYGYQPLSPGSHAPPESSNHAWNCVLLDGEWRLIDACWGAGALMNGTYNQRFAPVWFYSSPTEFGRRHFPTDRSYQLRSEEDGGPVSWEEFILDTDGPVLYGDFYNLEFSPDLVQPNVAEIQGPGYVNFQLFKQCEHMSREQKDNYVYFINLPDNSKTTLVAGAEGAWGASVYIPQGMKGDVSLNYITSFDNRDALGLSPQTFQSSIGRKAMAWQGLCKWTLV
ncbi:TGc domain-containing protein [Mycena indigotica]|uniref:TGc domain-containing protein n=1 Tax=Mycena indigotica TaxID=2126181 RepID=A0A8H6TF95_9AGAR|nr:TGc domain-containing protein [Mycena indigotica]KAF7315626.1 TGc domain-containing protein [Mycena indigotica]